MQIRNQDTPYGLRMPKGMREQVKAMAAENGRSMNAEIVFHLRKALGVASGYSGSQPDVPGTRDE
ncbi:Arc family DNA-binding protein [Paenirhodobacter ferrireducens]|nr:Arc family DNA-binding protein [Sinirhodobacter ferrireducens]